jgi:pyruvate formate lyase activating enzyme
MAYGNPCAINIDPVEKKPLYHFLPGSTAFSVATAGCNFACLNCQNWTISQTSPDKTRNYSLSPDELVRYAHENNCKSIAYTYSEPITFFEYVYDSSMLASEKGLSNIIVSNGYIKKGPLEDLCKVIDGANIDLKAFDNSTYLKLTGGKLEPVLETLVTLREQNVWLEITNLIVPEYSDDLDMIQEMCNWLVAMGFTDTPLHFSRFRPMYKLEQLPPTPVDLLNRAYNIAMEAGIKHVYIGNVVGTHASDTRCSSCGSTLLQRRGYTIIKNIIINASCSSCGEKIDGIWE